MSAARTRRALVVAASAVLVVWPGPAAAPAVAGMSQPDVPPAPIPLVEPRGPEPVPIPLVEPRGPEPVPIPLVESGGLLVGVDELRPRRSR